MIVSERSVRWPRSLGRQAVIAVWLWAVATIGSARGVELQESASTSPAPVPPPTALSRIGMSPFAGPQANALLNANVSLQADSILSEGIDDVAIQPDGVLLGKVVATIGGEMKENVSELRVTLFRGQECVAVTFTDDRGRFAVRNLPGGLYRVVVHTIEGPSCRLCQTWTYGEAPPHALGEARVPLGRRLVRGQNFPGIANLPLAVKAAAVTAAAIAAPVIYHNVKLDNRVPMSP